MEASNIKLKIKHVFFFVIYREISGQFLWRIAEDLFWLTEYGCSQVTQQRAMRYHRAQKKPEKELLGARWNKAFFLNCVAHLQSLHETSFLFPALKLANAFHSYNSPYW